MRGGGHAHLGIGDARAPPIKSPRTASALVALVPLGVQKSASSASTSCSPARYQTMATVTEDRRCRLWLYLKRVFNPDGDGILQPCSNRKMPLSEVGDRQCRELPRTLETSGSLLRLRKRSGADRSADVVQESFCHAGTAAKLLAHARGEPQAQPCMASAQAPTDVPAKKKRRLTLVKNVQVVVPYVPVHRLVRRRRVLSPLGD